MEGVLSDAEASSQRVEATVGSAFAAVDGSGSDSRVEVRLELRGDEINVQVSRAVVGGKRGPQPAFAEWLSKAIKRDGMSQEAAARAIGVSLKTVNRWARGETEPRFRELGMIQAAFGERPPLPVEPRAS